MAFRAPVRVLALSLMAESGQLLTAGCRFPHPQNGRAPSGLPLLQDGGSNERRLQRCSRSSTESGSSGRSPGSQQGVGDTWFPVCPSPLTRRVWDS